jgi:rhamnopyranosyl-N-acetylglucosaminyl-diphospho-decaprenol beta-1,3/1,4-galactofuranosyltransferase
VGQRRVVPRVVPRVVAVVVTWNRRALLTEALRAVRDQTRPPEVVVVVDNASTDGTSDLVRASFPEADLLIAERNTGGAGGFTLGVDRALQHGADLIWLMDDDTVPEPGALEALMSVHAEYPDGRRPSVLASRVLWTNGREHPMNTPRRKPGASRAESIAAQEVGCVPIRSASFVSVLLDAATVRERGLPMADFFLWNDDFEYTTRLLRDRVGLACPASVVVHKTKTFGSTDADPGERFYFEVRNKVWTFTRSRGLSPAEKAVYGGSTLLRWSRTLARSRDRHTLLRALRLGLLSGVRSRPRSAEQFLAQTPVAHDG